MGERRAIYDSNGLIFQLCFFLNKLSSQILVQVRPVVETGYENLLLVRLLVEMRVPSIRKSSVCIRHSNL